MEEQKINKMKITINGQDLEIPMDMNVLQGFMKAIPQTESEVIYKTVKTKLQASLREKGIPLREAAIYAEALASDAATTVARSIVLPILTTTEPSDCLASLPVSRVIVLPSPRSNDLDIGLIDII